MSGFAFSPQRVAQLRKQAGVVATLLPQSEGVAEHRLRHLYREFETHDEDGNVTGRRKEVVQDVGSAGELTPARITILLVEQVDVFDTVGKPLGGCKALDVLAARACGFRTAQDLREYWKSKHPRSDVAQLVWFALGDVRDKDRFLQRWVWRGGDYTNDRHAAVDELPALSPQELARVAANAQQRQVARQVTTATRLAEPTLAERVARLEATGDAMAKEIKQELRIITDRAARARKKLDK